MTDTSTSSTIPYRQAMEKSKIGFMDLPGEIRNKIYKLLLVLPPVYALQRLDSDERVYPLPLFLLCRQIHLEASDILYGQNTFIAHPTLLSSMPRLREYYGTVLSGSYTSLISRYCLLVRLDCDPQFTAQQVSSAFDSCESLVVEPWQAQFGSCDCDVLKLFEEVRGVKKAEVLGSTSAFLEYATWLEKSMMTKRGYEVEGLEKTKGLEKSKVIGGCYDIWQSRF